MKRISLSGYVSVQLASFLKPFVDHLPGIHKSAVKDLVLLIADSGSTMISRMARRMSWGPRRMIHREKRLCHQAKAKSFEDFTISPSLPLARSTRLTPTSCLRR